MKAQIVEIRQSYVLDTENVSNYMVLELPTGERVECPVGGETVAALLALKATGADAPPEVPRLRSIEPEMAPWPPSLESESPGTPVDETVNWMELGEDMLPLEVRAVLVESGIPTEVPLGKLLPLIEQIADQLAESEGEAVPTPAPKPQSGPTPLSTVGYRTVPKDEAGNPIVPQTNVPRPPEANVDEDGVPQL